LLAAAALDGLLDHPAIAFDVVSNSTPSVFVEVEKEFFNSR